MRYKCLDCQHDFDEQNLIHEILYDTVEYWGSDVKMPYNIYKCPYCGSEDIEEYNEYEEEENE